tara:strand:+ start:2030 stop:2575 length:546 start_codon:yes stop_codon:yes gene_type:complete
MSEFTNIKKYLEQVAKQIVRQSKGILKKEKGQTDLAKSIRYEVKKDDKGYTTNFYVADYGPYIDEGVSGNLKEQSYISYKGKKQTSRFKYTTKQPPSNMIEKWIKRKGLKPKGKHKSEESAIKSMAFAVSKSIKEKGIKGISFFQIPLGAGLKAINEDMLKAVAEDVKSYLVFYTQGKGQK